MRKIFLVLLGVMFAASSTVQAVSEVSGMIADADVLGDQGNYRDAMEMYLTVLEHYPDRYEAAWKAGDMATEIAKALPDEDKDTKEETFELARQYCEMAIQIDSTGWEGYTYLAIAQGRLALFRGGKEKINLSKAIKQNAEKGIALNPENDTAYHVLGRWHRNLANLSWVLKSFAKILYGGVPPGSNEEAVTLFKKAIEIDPNLINHHLELAKTYEKTGEKALMKSALENVLALPATEREDAEYKAEAVERLKKLK